MSVDWIGYSEMWVRVRIMCSLNPNLLYARLWWAVIIVSLVLLLAIRRNFQEGHITTIIYLSISCAAGCKCAGRSSRYPCLRNTWRIALTIVWSYKCRVSWSTKYGIQYTWSKNELRTSSIYGSLLREMSNLLNVLNFCRHRMKFLRFYGDFYINCFNLFILLVSAYIS